MVRLSDLLVPLIRLRQRIPDVDYVMPILHARICYNWLGRSGRSEILSLPAR